MWAQFLGITAPCFSSEDLLLPPPHIFRSCGCYEVTFPSYLPRILGGAYGLHYANQCIAPIPLIIMIGSRCAQDPARQFWDFCLSSQLSMVFFFLLIWHCDGVNLKLPRTTIWTERMQQKLWKRQKRNSENPSPDIIWILKPNAREGQPYHYVL